MYQSVLTFFFLLDGDAEPAAFSAISPTATFSMMSLILVRSALDILAVV